MAIAGSPTTSASESPKDATAILFMVPCAKDAMGTAMTARSMERAVPFILASAVVSSQNTTVSFVADSTTW